MNIKINSMQLMVIKFVSIICSDNNEYRVRKQTQGNDSQFNVEIWNEHVEAFLDFNYNDELRNFLIAEAKPLFDEEDDEPYPIA